MLSYIANDNLTEIHLISFDIMMLTNLQPGGPSLGRPGSLPLTWGMKWCRKGELGRESWWVELRLLVRRYDNRCTPVESSSAAAGNSGGRTKWKQRKTIRERQGRRLQRKKKKRHWTI